MVWILTGLRTDYEFTSLITWPLQGKAKLQLNLIWVLFIAYLLRDQDINTCEVWGKKFLGRCKLGLNVEKDNMFSKIRLMMEVQPFLSFLAHVWQPCRDMLIVCKQTPLKYVWQRSHFETNSLQFINGLNLYVRMCAQKEMCLIFTAVLSLSFLGTRRNMNNK